MSKKTFYAAAAISAASLMACSLYCGLTVRKYRVTNKKLKKPVRIVALSDLHGTNYGRRQSALLAKINLLAPDVVVMTGDMIDRGTGSITSAVELIGALSRLYRCCYCTGNHEVDFRSQKEIKALFSRYGVEVLDGKTSVLDINGQSIYISGVDDPLRGENRFIRQLSEVKKICGGPYPGILLSHRPERFLLYAKCGFDLALCGHAHGGQWRIPYLINGVIAPNQGLFPKYAGGKYEEDNMTMIVNRGLERYKSTFIPRIFNPPEVVYIDFVPDNLPDREVNNGKIKT